MKKPGMCFGYIETLAFHKTKSPSNKKDFEWTNVQTATYWITEKGKYHS